MVQTRELTSHVTLIDSRLEQTISERDEARDLIVWQRQLIQRQLLQVTERAYYYCYTF